MRHTDSGFTLVELMVVVLIIGILVAVAIPVFNSAKSKAQRMTCFANQRMIEGATALWDGAHPSGQKSDLAGPVNAANPLVTENFLSVPPACPAATNPPVNGTYTLDAIGFVAPCTWGSPVHGHY
jgi:prepilin-type N-terminal cleavage/methylation domain-containing protein